MENQLGFYWLHHHHNQQHPTAVNEIYAELYNTQQGLIGKKLISIMKSGGGEVRHIGSNQNSEEGGSNK